MIDYIINIYFKKFISYQQEIKFSKGINIIYGESGVGKSVFLSCLENPVYRHEQNFEIDVIIENPSIYRIVQNPDQQILTPTVQNEIAFTSECSGLKPIEVKKILMASLKKLPSTIDPYMNPGFLSGGEKELLNLITSLDTKPDILLIDDGLSFLSDVNKNLAISWLREWIDNSNGIVIWVSSEQNDLKYGDKTWELSLNSFSSLKKQNNVLYNEILIPFGYLNLSFLNLCFHYEQSRNIYSNLTLSIKNCRSFGLIGENGSGKTTLAGMCFGYLKPQIGQIKISVNGNDKPLIGYADQFPEYLLQLKTPEEFIKQLTENGIFNVELDKTFNNRLRRFNIYWDRIKNIQGIHLPWAVLRIFIIVALAHSKFDILILDEPTFGLGWNQRKKLRLFLRECMTNIHFIIVSHDQLFIQSICDQILDLDNIDTSEFQGEQRQKAKT